MSDVVEVMARAIVKHNYPSIPPADIDEMWDGWEGDAQAALEAYHEHLANDGSVVISVEWLKAVLAYANPIGVMGDHVFAEIRAMIAAAQEHGEG